MSAITEAVVARMKEMSPLDMAKAEVIAQEFGIKTRSVIASAGRTEDVEYIRKERVSKSGDPVRTKSDLVTEIAEATGVDVEALDGLDKATKTALVAIADSFISE